MSLPDLFPVLKGCRSYALLRYIPHHISGFFNTSIAKLIFPRMPPPRRTWFGRGASWLSAACTAELHVLNDEYIRQWHQGVKLVWMAANREKVHRNTKKMLAYCCVYSEQMRDDTTSSLSLGVESATEQRLLPELSL